MRNFLSCLFIVLLSFGLFINEASAKRFGGGRSFGVQRSHSSLFSSHKPKTTALKGQRANTGKWGGILGGALIGGLLASLFMGHGLMNGLITWLMLGFAVFLIVSLLRKKMQPGMQFAQSNANAFRSNSYNNFAQSNAFGNSSTDFDEEGFLRNAKVTFIRLQAAYDQKNLQDIQSFTSPEVYAEIKMQLNERGDKPNKTEVIDLNARLLDVSKQTQSTVASVHFTGSIKEDEAIIQLDEIWHFYQFTYSNEWLVSGIQQEVYQP
ncbi:Tim44 domain-containing protein [Legionella israelensis]|uniref:Tim44 domain-containing protein n=1 Tax=Legionella israelensis TaxID=454 RepID=A0AAX1EJD3_9GAMM|nr:Tim44-like domain-containing protein [Legionella israelensis]QBR85148.1 Tim44 domain-containing protein [Legionella israelensis]